ncbi:unnamed protein product, partial [Polarella glacialis]
DALPTSEELQLETEIKSIEMDIAMLDLRRELEAQEELVANWRRSVHDMGEDSRLDEVAMVPRTAEDRREEKEMKHGLIAAQESVDKLRQRLASLELLRSEPTEPELSEHVQ